MSSALIQHNLKPAASSSASRRRSAALSSAVLWDGTVDFENQPFRPVEVVDSVDPLVAPEVGLGYGQWKARRPENVEEPGLDPAFRRGVVESSHGEKFPHEPAALAAMLREIDGHSFE